MNRSGVKTADAMAQCRIFSKQLAKVFLESCGEGVDRWAARSPLIASQRLRPATRPWWSTAAAAVNTIDASHKDPGTAYAAMLSRDGDPHLYRTADYGAHWQEISSGLDDGNTVDVPRLIGRRHRLGLVPARLPNDCNANRRQLRDRLFKELESNVALKVAPSTERRDEFNVSGRGLLHLSILIENMRREGFEMSVGKPRVITKQVNGQTVEPIEYLVVEVPFCVFPP